MKKILILSGIVIVAAALVFFILKKNAGKISYNEIRPEIGPISVEFRETGSVNPRNRLEIKPPVEGRIEDILVVEGQKVKKGEVIAYLSSTERAALLDAARSKGDAELKKWEDIYKPTPIISPLDGFIIARSKEPGQAVSASDVILVMADTLIIEADVDETDLRYIKLGQTVNIMLDAYSDTKFKGMVEHIAYESQVINNVTVYTVKIKPLSIPENFRAGMTATVVVDAERKDNALILPFDSVTQKNGKYSVLVRSLDGKPETRPIETGISNGKYIEITSGLGENDIVLVQGKQKKQRKSTTAMPGLPGMGGGRH